MNLNKLVIICTILVCNNIGGTNPISNSTYINFKNPIALENDYDSQIEVSPKTMMANNFDNKLNLSVVDKLANNQKDLDKAYNIIKHTDGCFMPSPETQINTIKNAIPNSESVEDNQLDNKRIINKKNINKKVKFKDQFIDVIDIQKIVDPKKQLRKASTVRKETKNHNKYNINAKGINNTIKKLNYFLSHNNYSSNDNSKSTNNQQVKNSLVSNNNIEFNKALKDIPKFLDIFRQNENNNKQFTHNKEVNNIVYTRNEILQKLNIIDEMNSSILKSDFGIILSCNDLLNNTNNSYNITKKINDITRCYVPINDKNLYNIVYDKKHDGNIIDNLKISAMAHYVLFGNKLINNNYIYNTHLTLNTKKHLIKDYFTRQDMQFKSFTKEDKETFSKCIRRVLNKSMHEFKNMNFEELTSKQMFLIRKCLNNIKLKFPQSSEIYSCNNSEYHKKEFQEFSKKYLGDMSYEDFYKNNTWDKLTEGQKEELLDALSYADAQRHRDEVIINKVIPTLYLLDALDNTKEFNILHSFTAQNIARLQNGDAVNFNNVFKAILLTIWNQEPNNNMKLFNNNVLDNIKNILFQKSLIYLAISQVLKCEYLLYIDKDTGNMVEKLKYNNEYYKIYIDCNNGNVSLKKETQVKLFFEN